MNEHTLRVLEYDKILGIVAGYAATEAGKRNIGAMLPEAELSFAAVRLRETGEFLAILERGEIPPLNGILDVSQAVSKLGAAGIMLTPAELLNTAITLSAGRRVKQFFLRQDDKHGAQLLNAKADAIRGALEQVRALADTSVDLLRRDT